MPLTDKDIAEQFGTMQLQIIMLAAENRDLRARIAELENGRDKKKDAPQTNEPVN